MVCILCDSKVTTTNSRYRRASRTTWRRHTCPRCQAVYTTRESVDMAVSYRVRRSDESLSSFSRDKLYVSIFQSIELRGFGHEDANELTTTVIASVQSAHQLIIGVENLRSLVLTVLRRFDNGSALIYAARYPVTTS
jgi:transcriptional regulator NrdR family protein